MIIKNAQICYNKQLNKIKFCIYFFYENSKSLLYNKELDFYEGDI